MNSRTAAVVSGLTVNLVYIIVDAGIEIEFSLSACDEICAYVCVSCVHVHAVVCVREPLDELALLFFS